MDKNPEETAKIILSGFDEFTVGRFIRRLDANTLKLLIEAQQLVNEFRGFMAVENGNKNSYTDETDSNEDFDENEDAVVATLKAMMLAPDFMTEDDLKQILDWYSEDVIDDKVAIEAIKEGNRNAVRRFLLTVLKSEDLNGNRGNPENKPETEQNSQGK